MPGNPLTDPNWADETTDTVIRLVGTTRDKVTTPIVYSARAVVYGLIAIFLVLFSLVIFLIMTTRALQAALDWQLPHARSVYISYLIIGGILSAIGLLLFRKRSRSAA